MDIATLFLVMAGGMIAACGGWLVVMALEGGRPVPGLDLEDEREPQSF
jgi:hypothetical protein